MKKRTSVKEISTLCEMLIQDFMTSSHRSSRRLIDIEAFVTRYLGAKLTYETFAEDVPGRGGFFADGITSLHILRNGIRQNVVFPKNTIVIDSSLKHPDEIARLRFTIAHEAAHLIMSKHIPGGVTAAFHTEYVEGGDYTPQMLKSMMTTNETITNRAAACLLMPSFIVERALNTYNNGDKITIYLGSDVVITDQSKRIIQRMADSMGVSFSACYYRLKETDRLDIRPLEEYAQVFNCEDNENVRDL